MLFRNVEKIVAVTAELCLQILLAALPAMSVEFYFNKSGTCFIYFHFYLNFNFQFHSFSLAALPAMSVEFYFSIYRAAKWCMRVESLRLIRKQHMLLQLERLMQCVS